MADFHRTSACLRFFGDHLNPSELSESLGRPATHAWRMGELYSVEGVGSERPTGAWILEANSLNETDLESVVKGLLFTLTLDLSIWNDLFNRYYCDIFCGLFPEERAQVSALSPATIQMLGDRGLGLVLDIYSSETSQVDQEPNVVWFNLPT